MIRNDLRRIKNIRVIRVIRVIRPHPQRIVT